MGFPDAGSVIPIRMTRGCAYPQAPQTLRRLRMTAAEIAEILGMALSTVSRWLKRIGLGKRSRLEPPEPPNRYKRIRPGELLHVDVKKLGRISRRGAGHRVTGHRAAVQGRTPAAGRDRLGVLPRLRRRRHSTRLRRGASHERSPTAAGFLRRAAAWFASMGVEGRGGAARQWRLLPLGRSRRRLLELGLRHLFTRPYRPRTNGKAERFIQTLADRWAYGAIYGTSAERTRALPGWLSHYNFRRRHGSLGHRPPAARLCRLEQRGG